MQSAGARRAAFLVLRACMLLGVQLCHARMRRSAHALMRTRPFLWGLRVCVHALDACVPALTLGGTSSKSCTRVSTSASSKSHLTLYMHTHLHTHTHPHTHTQAGTAACVILACVALNMGGVGGRRHARATTLEEGDPCAVVYNSWRDWNPEVCSPMCVCVYVCVGVCVCV